MGNDGNGDQVASLATAGNVLYAGGEFSTASGVPATGVAQWSLQTPGWSALGSGLGCVSDDCTGSYAEAVDAAPGGIYVTGNLGTADGKGSDNLALWTRRRPGSHRYTRAPGGCARGPGCGLAVVSGPGA